MPPPESSAIDQALVDTLAQDPTLAALVPDGVWIDEAPAGARRFVIVSLVESVDVATHPEGRAVEDGLFLVKAVMRQGTPGADIRAAVARIDALLEDQPLTVTGFTWSTTHREDRIRITEVDEVDEAIRWQHRGGRYRVQMAIGT